MMLLVDDNDDQVSLQDFLDQNEECLSEDDANEVRNLKVGEKVCIGMCFVTRMV